MPSPNMPTLDTAIVYPGTVLFEGTMLSEGRGTTRPFELIGAPWLDGDGFAARMNACRADGVHFRAATFEPTFQKHAQDDLRRLPDPRDRRGRTSRRSRSGVSLLRECYGLAPDRLQMARSALRIRARQDADRHPGGLAELREQIEQQVPLADIVASWRPGETEFAELRRPYLLY